MSTPTTARVIQVVAVQTTDADVTTTTLFTLEGQHLCTLTPQEAQPTNPDGTPVPTPVEA